jgi:hypothetical protein
MTTPHPYVPAGPVEATPYLGYCLPEVRPEAFCAVLDGIEMGAYDRRIVTWLARWADTTCRTIASLMWRCCPCGRGGGKKGHDDRDNAKARTRARTAARTMAQRQDILYCENTACLIRRRQRPVAVTLASIWSGALIPSCDECARSQYNHQPGAYRVLPLSAYRDWYAEARSHAQDAVGEYLERRTPGWRSGT